jgi:hypothetical protein
MLSHLNFAACSSILAIFFFPVVDVVLFLALFIFLLVELFSLYFSPITAA